MLDITQVTCLLFFLLTLLLTSKSRSAAEVSVCFTQRLTPSPPPSGALHVNNPNYTETTRDSCFYYRTAPLCRQQGISAPRLNTEMSERRRRGREVWSGVDEVSWLLAVVMPLFTAPPSLFWSCGALYMSEQKVNACWEWVYKEIRI